MCLLFCFVLFWIFCCVVCEKIKIKIVDNKKKIELQEIYNKKVEYALFRLGTTFYEEGEKTGKLLGRQLKKITQSNQSCCQDSVLSRHNYKSSVHDINAVYKYINLLCFNRVNEINAQ